MFNAYQQSPLTASKRRSASSALPTNAGICLSERMLGHINLRGNPNDAGFCQAVTTVLGVALPLPANTVSADQDISICWLGPDEWLILTAADEVDETVERLRNACAEFVVAVTDISSGQTVINVSGMYSREMLAKGCSLDLASTLFSPGCCAQTLLAKASVILQINQDESIDVVVRRSFADYLWQWLTDASTEYGLAIV